MANLPITAFADENLTKGGLYSALNELATYLNGAIGENGTIEGVKLKLGLDEDFAEIRNSATLSGEIKAIYSSLDGAYTIPASGVVDENGFMYCDGSTIPNGKVLSGVLPNLTDGRFLRGSTSSGGAGGSETFSLLSTNIPAHTHDFSATSESAGSHTHSANHSHTGSTNSAGNHNHSVTVAGNSDGGTPYIGINSKGNSQTKYTNYGGAHSHTVTINTANVTTSTHAGHTHTISGTTSSYGSGAAKSHIPKYVNVQYVIKVD